MLTKREREEEEEGYAAAAAAASFGLSWRLVTSAYDEAGNAGVSATATCPEHRLKRAE